jgi:hypothetical protein
MPRPQGADIKKYISLLYAEGCFDWNSKPVKIGESAGSLEENWYMKLGVPSDGSLVSPTGTRR